LKEFKEHCELAKSLGIGFSSSSIYFTELSTVAGTGNAKADHIESVKVDFDFDDDLGKHKSSQKDLTNISSEISTYVKKRSLSISKAALSIGTSQAFLVTLPIDFSDGKQTVNSKIYWELSNYFPENYNDYVVNTYRLNNVLPCKDSDEYLIIAVHKNTIEFIKRIFKICGLELSLIDIDHFSAEKALRINYSEGLEAKRVLIAGLKSGRVDYGFIENMKYKYYAYSKYGSETEFNLSFTRKLSQLLESEPLNGNIDALYLYGDEIREDTLEALRRLNNIPVEVMNPFESISASEVFLSNENLRKNLYRYSASCGAALRDLKASKAVK
jgi:Tfp pilus assembly PilM family ATPase